MPVETEWQVSRLEARGRGGMVAAKTPQAAAAGADVLRRGGNAVDAAVTTAFTAGVVEPWMNGIGGGGYMVVQAPDEAPAVVAYPMVAPAGARPEMFPAQRRRQRCGALRLAGGGRQRQCLGLSLGRRAGDSRGARPRPGALGDDLAGRGAGAGDPLGRGGGSRLLAHHPDDRRSSRHAEAVSRHGDDFSRRRRQSARHPGAGSSPLAAPGGPGAHPARHCQRWAPRDVRGIARADHRRRSRRQRRPLHPR